jgi:predicted SAM-dependent methyltransferase
MDWRNNVKELAQRFEILALLRSVKHVSLRFRGAFLNYSDRRLANEYFRRDRPYKLQIGAGRNLLPGWLNTNFEFDFGVFFLDATGRFPFPDNTFEYIYSEHMVEHVPYQAGEAMLKECLRVLRPGGVMRIATPDLQFLIKLYSDPETDLHRRYIRWSCDNVITDCPSYHAGFVLNNFVREWGHQFIYD